MGLDRTTIQSGKVQTPHTIASVASKMVGKGTRARQRAPTNPHHRRGGHVLLHVFGDHLHELDLGPDQEEHAVHIAGRQPARPQREHLHHVVLAQERVFGHQTERPGQPLVPDHRLSTGGSVVGLGQWSDMVIGQWSDTESITLEGWKNEEANLKVRDGKTRRQTSKLVAS